jgi:hypothetical protein
VPTNTATAIPTATTPPTNTATATATATAIPTTIPTTIPTATATPEGPSVLKIALVNADTNTVIAGYETMPDGITLDLTLLPTENLNMWTTLSPNIVGYVEVTLTGAASRTHTEFFFPYTFPGNSGFDFAGYNFVVGNYTLTFDPYALDGTHGTPFVFNFTVIRSTVQQVSPILDCVTDNGGGWYTAYFGYQNNSSFVVNIPLGVDNRFLPDPPFRGQPANFDPGIHKNVVTTNFQSSESISWQLGSINVSANSSSPPCSP